MDNLGFKSKILSLSLSLTSTHALGPTKIQVICYQKTLLNAMLLNLMNVYWLAFEFQLLVAYRCARLFYTEAHNIFCPQQMKHILS